MAKASTGSIVVKQARSAVAELPARKKAAVAKVTKPATAARAERKKSAARKGGAKQPAAKQAPARASSSRKTASAKAAPKQLAGRKVARPASAAKRAPTAKVSSAKVSSAKAGPARAATAKTAARKLGAGNSAARSAAAKAAAPKQPVSRRAAAKAPPPSSTTRRPRAVATPKRTQPTPAQATATPPQSFTVSHLNQADFKTDGLRSYAQYRDLGIAAATAGLCQAHVIRFTPPCTDEVRKRHQHAVDLQLVYVLQGWIKNEFDGVGEQMMSTGTCWLQPSGIRHTVLDYSADCEVLEIILPADFKTEEVD